MGEWRAIGAVAQVARKPAQASAQHPTPRGLHWLDIHPITRHPPARPLSPALTSRLTGVSSMNRELKMSRAAGTMIMEIAICELEGSHGGAGRCAGR